MKKIYVALSSFSQSSDEPLNRLKDSGYALMHNDTGKRFSKEQLLALDNDIHGFIAGLEPYDKDVLGHFSQLKCISRCGVGIDNVDVQEAESNGVVICNTPEEIIAPVAELTLAMILSLMRRLNEHTNLIAGGQWKRLGGALLSEQTVGIVGTGRIGKKVAALLRAFGSRVIAYDLYPDKVWAKGIGVEYCSIDQLVSKSDIVTLHLSGDGGVDFCLGAAELKKMKKDACVINTSRGKFIDENALFEVLQSGLLAGAALDVFEKEPYQGPLAILKNVILTPHIGSLTAESRVNMEVKAVENLLSVLNQKG